MKRWMTVLFLAAAVTCSGGIEGVATGRRFLADGKLAVGMNYWGSKWATQMWRRWDAASVDEDLRVLAANGMRLLRVFPNWADFQPIYAVPLNGGNWNKVNEIRMFPSEEKLPDTPAGFAGVDERMMERFASFCDMAEKHGIRLIVPILTGQMTFRNLVPPALLHVDLYGDPQAIKWEMRFVDYFVRRLKDKKAIVAWESGNETRMIATNTGADQAEAWQRYIHSVIRLADDSRPIVGVDGLELTRDSVWPTKVNAMLSDYVTVHPYHHISGNAYRDSVNGIRLAFFCAAQNTLQEDVAGKPSFVEEHAFRRAPAASRELTARYLDGLLWNLWSCNARAMLWWCAFDQDHLDTAPYDWRQVYQEFGIMKSDRSPYPYTHAIRDFAAFQDRLPFAALPPARREALFVVDNAETAQAAYILARQAGFMPRFAAADEKIPDAKAYFIPCALGRNHIGTRAWEDLERRVRDGATLYVSWNDTFFPRLHEITGVELQSRRVAPGGEAVATFAALTAEKAMDLPDGNALYRNRFGKGTVYYATYPMEKRLYARTDGFACDAWRAYAAVFPTPQLVEDGARDVTTSEHRFADGKTAVIVVNNAVEPYAGAPKVADGWRVTSALTDRPDLARWSGGRLELGANAGILLMLEREPSVR